MTHDEVMQIAKDVLDGKSRSYVDAAKVLSRWVLDNGYVRDLRWSIEHPDPTPVKDVDPQGLR